METSNPRLIEHWRAELRQPGFCFVPAHHLMGQLSPEAMAGFDRFSQSWNDLHTDGYMADKGRYRKRRHAAFELSACGDARRLSHRAHFQATNYNSLNGGIERHFSPIEEQIARYALFIELLSLFAKLVHPLATDVHQWFVEAHQFRIEPNDTEAGKPTPEGMHRDGVDYVLVMMVNRENIAAGTTTLHDSAGLEIGSFTLARPFEAVWIDDRRVFHGVTAVHPKVSGVPAKRDVLVLTLKHQN
jgi:hypothetical protein